MCEFVSLRGRERERERETIKKGDTRDARVLKYPQPLMYWSSLMSSKFPRQEWDVHVTLLMLISLAHGHTNVRSTANKQQHQPTFHQGRQFSAAG